MLCYDFIVKKLPLNSEGLFRPSLKRDEPKIISNGRNQSIGMQVTVEPSILGICCRTMAVNLRKSQLTMLISAKWPYFQRLSQKRVESENDKNVFKMISGVKFSAQATAIDVHGPMKEILGKNTRKNRKNFRNFH